MGNGWGLAGVASLRVKGSGDRLAGDEEIGTRVRGPTVPLRRRRIES